MVKIRRHLPSIPIDHSRPHVFHLMFEDRRGRGDRREQQNREASSRGHCRRVGERRNILRQYHPQPWWLQTNYAEELQPPTLDLAPLEPAYQGSSHHIKI